MLLAGLASAPHLATVEIAPSGRRFSVYTPPSVTALQMLFEQTETTSRVHVTLRVPSDIDPVPFELLVSARFTLLSAE